MGLHPHEAASPGHPQPPALGAYSDFREYLRAFYRYKRRTLSTPLRPYNYGTFSAAADIKSPSYLKLIIDGKRNLSSSMMDRFSKALGHNREETREFRALVEYGQAKDPLERNKLLKALAEIRVEQRLKSGEIDSSAWEKVPGWVTWVLHAMAEQESVNFDPMVLRQLMRGRASLDEIQKALAKLLSEGELLLENGQMKKGRKLMAGSENVSKEQVRKLQMELIYLGLESLFQDGPEEREFGAFTLALTKEEFEMVKFEFRQLRKRLYRDLQLKREQSKGDRVYQLNIQIFPVTEESDLSDEREGTIVPTIFRGGEGERAHR